MHHLSKNENIMETVRNLLGNELDKVWHQLVQTWVLAKAGIPRGAVILACFVQKGAANLFKVELELPRKHMLHQWLDSHIACATNCRQCGVRIRTLRDQFEVARIGCSWVLRDGGLHTFDSQPVG